MGSFFPYRPAMLDIDAIIDRLGGPEATARLTGVGTRGDTQVAAVARCPKQALGRGDRRHRPAALCPLGRPKPGYCHARIRNARRRHRCARARGRHRVLGPRLRRAQRWPRRRGLLQHRHERLSGDADRPVICRADHHLHLPAYRQHRRQPGGPGGDDHRRPGPGGAAGCDRAEQLALHPAARRLVAVVRRAWASPASTPARSPSASATPGRPAASSPIRPMVVST